MTTIERSFRELPEPLSLTTGAIHTIVVSPFRVRLLELEDTHFHTDSAVMLPSPLVSADGDASPELVSGLGVLRQGYLHAKRNPQRSLVLTGHTDTVGGSAFNLTLSRLRAQNVLHLLLGERELWAASCDARHKVEDVQQILAFVDQTFGFGCDPGPIDNIAGPRTEAATRAFQERYSREFPKPIAVDGIVGKETFGAFFDLYMRALADLMEVGETELDALRAGVRFVDEKQRSFGCGENHPLDPGRLDSSGGAQDGFRSATNRRVELLFFDPGEFPEFPCHPEAGTCVPEKCELYDRTKFRFVPLPVESGKASLRVSVTDPQGTAVPQADVSISGPTARSGVADAAGSVLFEELQPGSYEVRARKDGFNEGETLAVVQLAPDVARAGGAADSSTTVQVSPQVGQLAILVRSQNTGNGIADAAVQFSGPLNNTAATDAQGTLSIELPVGTYTITASKPNFDSPPAASVTVVAATETPLTIDLSSQIDWTIRVTDQLSTSVIGGGIVRISGPFQAERTTDATGSVRFEGIPAGTYQVETVSNNGVNDTFTQSVSVAGTLVTVLAVPRIPTTTASIQIARDFVLVKKGQSTPARVAVTLRSDRPFGGDGVFTRSGAAIKFFTAATGGTEVTFNGTDNKFTGSQLATGVQVFAEGATASAALLDVTLALNLSGGLGPLVAGTAAMTSVELTLELSQSRTSATVDPPLLSAADKLGVGRFVHVQDPGNHHGRAILVVRQPKPAAFNRNLVLTPRAVGAAGTTSGTVRLFAAETPTAGEAPLSPASVVAANLAAAAAVLGSPGLRFFVEGSGVSAALRDAVVQLGVDASEVDGDRIALTVVRLRDLRAEIDSTQARTPRFGNSPVPKSTFTVGGAAAIAAVSFDEDDAINSPLFLVEGSLATALDLSVLCTPANVPVSWSVLRDTRPTGGDNPALRGLSGLPTMPSRPTASVPSAATRLRATLLADGVGTFRVRAFVDGNGNGDFDRDPAADASFAAEPFILMNLVLLRVEGVSNASRSRSTPPGGGPGSVTGAGGAAVTAATGVQLSTGGFTQPDCAALNDAVIRVIGGGPNGLRGLDPARIFGGWVNNELDAATPATRPNASGEDVVSEYLDTTGAAPATHSRISVWVNTATKFFVPGGTPPVLVPGPVLDVSPFGNEGRGGNRAVGTEGAIGPPSLVKTPVAATATDPGGQTWQILMFDSPGDSCPPVLTSLPGTLASYRFNLDFQSDLVVWTNVRGVPDPTPGPIQPGSAAPDAACCLYSSVQTNTWNIRFAIAFVPATGAVVGGVPTINVTLTKDASATRRARPVGAALETRAPPTALSLLGVQERT